MAKVLTRAQKKLHAAGLPVACFGKLPLYEDFLRVPGGEGSRAFADWMDRGFGLRWDDLGGEPETVAAPARVLFVAPKGIAVCAVLSDSHDRGGLRRFPFAAMTEFPARAIDAKSPAFVLGLAPVWAALEAVAAEASALPSAAEFYAAVRGRRVTPESPERAPADELRAPLTGMALDHSYLSNILLALGGALSHHGFRQRDRMALAYRLPLVAGTQVEFQAGGWSRLLARNWWKHSGLPSLILPRTTADGGTFTILFRPLEPRDVRLLSDRADRADRVVHGNRDATYGEEWLRADVARRLGENPTWADLSRLRLPHYKFAAGEETS